MAEYDERSEGNGHGPAKHNGLADGRRSQSQLEAQPHEGRSSKSRERDREGHENKGRERDRDSRKDRERYPDREMERDRSYRNRDYDHHRREHRERRDHCSDDRDRRRSHDLDVERRDRDRDGYFRHRSRSCSSGRSKRVSGFDQGPSQAIPIVAPSVTSDQLPAVPAAIRGSGVLPNTYNPTIAGQPQAMTQQATRHARRVYVGGLPPTANEQTVAIYFNQVMAAIGGNTAGRGDAVVNVYINHDKKFAFVEMRSVDEASNAMALDGIKFEGAPVKVRRPTDYNPSLAATLGPSC